MEPPSPFVPRWNPVVIDGPMGTALIDRGVSPAAVFQANVKHPTWVQEVHREYLSLGASVFLTNTFMAAAAFATDAKTATHGLDAAIEHCQSVVDVKNTELGRKIYLSLGPLPFDQAFADLVLDRVRSAALDGVWLETFDDRSSLLDHWRGALSTLPLVITTLPTTQPRSMESTGQTLVARGFNCVSGSLELPVSRPIQTIPFIWKPAVKLGSHVLPFDALRQSCERLRPDWIGLCCGGTAKLLKQLMDTTR